MEVRSTVLMCGATCVGKEQPWEMRSTLWIEEHFINEVNPVDVSSTFLMRITLIEVRNAL